jgi:SET domain-containing protein
MPQKRSTKGKRSGGNTTARKGTARKRTSGKGAAKKSAAHKSTARKSAARKNAGRKRTGGSAAKKSSATKSSRQPFVVRRSPVQGRGAFATRDIRRGERVGEYRGERVSWEEADRRYDDESQGRHHTFLFEVDDDTVIDAAVRGSAAKYINHSCDPNCEAVIEGDRVFIDAIRPIRAGDELFYDYNYLLDEAHTAAVKKRYPCWCGSRKCRGTILGRKR